jgi:dipeptidyl aminopeptidase/acylaminoacyl peptidase
MQRYLVGLIVLVAAAPAFAQEGQKRAMKIDDMFRFQRVSDPQISPDGKHVVYVVGAVDMEANKVIGNLWLAPTDPKAGPPKKLTSAAKSDRHPRWSPSGKFILFESTRSGDSQLWSVPVAGGEPKQLTNLSTGASTGLWSRDGGKIAFVSVVFPEFSTKPYAESDSLNKKKIEERAKNPVKVRVFTKLFFRHWDEYVEDKRQHLFVVEVAEADGGIVALGAPRDVTPGDRDAYPTSSTFSVGDDFTFSPDGKHLYFTAVPEKNEAWSTNFDICRVPVGGGAWETITGDNPAADGAPQFSPDGKWLAYRAQRRPGFEADRWELMLLPTADLDKFVPPAKVVGKEQDKDKDQPKLKPRSHTSEFTGWVNSIVWLPDSETIYFETEERAKNWYYVTRLGRKDGDATVTYLSHNSNSGLTVSKDGKTMAFVRAALHHPPEVFVATDAGGEGDWKVRNLSQANAKQLAEMDVPEPETLSVIGAGGQPVQMWILKPPGFDAKKKWPLAFLVHGGPQGAWEDGWSYRWCPSLWAAQGYVVALPNPRGSTGFGQQFIDEISGDWGGRCYEDLMACLAHMEKQPWIDPDRMASAGASFGGYMMNWFAVNTGKFKTLINHCGVWNFDSMYATTEELWFDEWEHGGPPWGKNRNSYDKHSPHKFAVNLQKHKTPMLIIHNDLDFRVPVSEGLQLFTTLQRMNIPSRFINFPDEGHHVLRPRNSQYWHQEVFGWLKKHVAPGGK